MSGATDGAKDAATVTIRIDENALTNDDWYILNRLVDQERTRLTFLCDEPTGYRVLADLKEIRNLERKLHILTERFTIADY